MWQILYIVLAILMLGILIVVHELGHFLMARWTGVRVEEFSVGFGPKLASRTSRRSGTCYSWRALPLGGFCRFADEDGSAEEIKADSFFHAKVWKRALICASGPLMNILAAFLALILLYAAVGLIGVSPVIDSVMEGQPAQLAGFEEGDRLVAINGTQIDDVETAAEIIAQAGENALEVVVERGEEKVSLSVTPVWVEEENRSMIGIMYRTMAVRLPILTSLQYAAEDTWSMAGAILNFLREMVTTGKGTEDVTGVIGTVAVISEETQTGGIRAYLSLAAVISVNLGLFNMLPVPGLDGSKLLFLLIEKLRGKPVSPEKEGMVTFAGMALLILLTVFIMYKDITRLFL